MVTYNTTSRWQRRAYSGRAAISGGRHLYVVPQESNQCLWYRTLVRCTRSVTSHDNSGLQRAGAQTGKMIHCTEALASHMHERQDPTIKGNQQLRADTQTHDECHTGRSTTTTIITRSVLKRLHHSHCLAPQAWTGCIRSPILALHGTQPPACLSQGPAEVAP